MTFKLSPAQVASTTLPYLTDGNSFTPFDALAQLWETAEVRTTLSPPVKVNVLGLGRPSGPPSPLITFLKPTLILTGPAGQTTFAPHGEAGQGEGRRNLALVGVGLASLATGLVLAGYLLGRAQEHE